MHWYRILIMGIFCCGTGVALGAFGAHALKARLSEYALGVFETGVRYQFYHGLGLIAIGLLAERLGNATSLTTIAITMFLGIVFFSGSLYILALSGLKWWGAVAPIGGLMFIVSWFWLAFKVYRLNLT